MKSFKLLLSCVALAACAAAPVLHAEDTPAAASSGSEKLTPAQEAKIAALHKEEAKALKALKEDKKMKEADKKAKTKSIKEDFKAQIEAVKAGK